METSNPADGDQALILQTLSVSNIKSPSTPLTPQNLHDHFKLLMDRLPRWPKDEYKQRLRKAFECNVDPMENPLLDNHRLASRLSKVGNE